MALIICHVCGIGIETRRPWRITCSPDCRRERSIELCTRWRAAHSGYQQRWRAAKRLERALAVAAYCVLVDGEIARPLFNRLQRELAELREKRLR